MWFTLDPATYHKYYNCNVLTDQEWQLYIRPNLDIALLYFIPGLIYLILYIPTLLVITTAEFQKNTSYILMTFISIADVIALPCGSIFTAYNAFKGYSFCHIGLPSYLISVLALPMWYIASSLTVILGLNRCLDFINPDLADFLFSDKKVYIWIAFAYLFGICLMLFLPVPVFSDMAFFFDPYFGIDKVNAIFDSNYQNIPHDIFNIVVVGSLFCVYSILCIYVLIQYYKNHKISLTTFQTKMFIQSLIITGFSTIAASIYVYMNYFPVNRYLLIIAHMAFQGSHGVTALTCMILNNTVKRTFYKNYFPGWLKGSEITIINVTPATLNANIK
uniref:Serpentine Receptor, class T n=1 Tax=Rhabditophanes sp. KR3021 TaxID=114890 RepID=A0AC35UDI3_9BILA